MSDLKKRKDGYYRRSVKLDGMDKPKEFYGKTEREITRKIAEWKQEVEKGKLFKTVAEEWETQHFPTLEYNTLKGYKPALKRAIDEFGDKYIREITPTDIHSYIMRFSRQKYAMKTVKTQLLIINLICTKAVIDGDTQYNPCSSVKIPKNLPKKKRELPSQEDMDAVTSNTGRTFGLFPFFLLYTGCRRGEALAVTYADIDRKNKSISVTKSVYHDNNKAMLKYPKTKAGYRNIILFDILLEKLPQGKPHDLLFPNEHGELMTETQFQRQWELYVKETGIQCTPHQLRHGFATILFEAGVNAKDAQILLGHSNLSTTLDIYTHITDQRMKDTADLVNNKLNQTKKV